VSLRQVAAFVDLCAGMEVIDIGCTVCHRPVCRAVLKFRLPAPATGEMVWAVAERCAPPEVPGSWPAVTEAAVLAGRIFTPDSPPTRMEP
jgi:hypothetical protein